MPRRAEASKPDEVIKSHAPRKDRGRGGTDGEQMAAAEGRSFQCTLFPAIVIETARDLSLTGRRRAGDENHETLFPSPNRSLNSKLERIRCDRKLKW